MRTKMKSLILFLGLMLLCAVEARAQTATTVTYLTAAVDATNETINVASATGLTANTTAIYVDRELMIVRSVSGTAINVRRGQSGSIQESHLVNAVAWVGPLGNSGPFASTDGTVNYRAPGPCVRTSIPYLPQINVQTGSIWDCPVMTTIGGASNVLGTTTATQYNWQNLSMIGAQPVSEPYRAVINAAYTAAATDYFINYVSMTAARTVTLPSVTTSFGKQIIVKNSGFAQTLTVLATNGQWIGSLDTASVALSPGGILRLISVGGGWATW